MDECERKETHSGLSGQGQTGYVGYLPNIERKTGAEVISRWGLQLSGYLLDVSFI